MAGYNCTVEEFEMTYASLCTPSCLSLRFVPLCRSPQSSAREVPSAVINNDNDSDMGNYEEEELHGMNMADPGGRCPRHI